MRMTIRTLVAATFGAALMIAGPALAQCGSGCAPPAPPSPPVNPGPPKMPGHGCGGGGGCGGGKTSVNVNVNVNASGSGSGSGSGGGTYYGGGYGNWSQTPGYPSSMPLNVMTLAPAVTQQVETWQETISRTKTMMLQATCLDVKGAPHPASQVFGGREVEGRYIGELYRCIAGTYMQVTMVEQGGSAQHHAANFNGGKVLTCRKGEALWFEGGQVSCRTQSAARTCNERSLLRRFGVGIKIVTMSVTEVVTRTRQTASASQTSRYSQTAYGAQSGAAGSVMVFDGGVGGFVQ